jgi:vitamin B12 transporter
MVYRHVAFTLALLVFAGRARAQQPPSDAGLADEQRSPEVQPEPEPAVQPEPEPAVQPEPRAADGGGAAAPDTSAPPPAAPIEVRVRAQQSPQQRLQESAEAVSVIDTRKAKQQTADLGEVLARSQGVSVRRSGGLGSDALISMGGLQGEQIRLFIDGLPLALGGFPIGIANIPVNWVDAVEKYHGVVPLRFGADALGGAINLVTDTNRESHLVGSYQVGSFGVQRATVNGRYRDDPNGFVVGGGAFVDWAENNYYMNDRALWNADGTSTYRDVKRFHSGYSAFGGNLEAGLFDRSWAKKLVLSAFGLRYDRDIQHNAVMSAPYGEVTSGETNYGATVRHEVLLLPQLALETLANYNVRAIGFEDLATHRYTWTGQRDRPVGRNNARGEISSQPADTVAHERSIFGRMSLGWTPSREHKLVASVTPQFASRYTDDLIAGRENLKLEGGLLRVVGGGEYTLNLWDDTVENVAFVKTYYLHTTQEVDVQRPTGKVILEGERDRNNFGGGNALRVRFNSWLLAKASWEYATRLPTSMELFGDGVFVTANTELNPERSHNLNFNLHLDAPRTRAGDLQLDVNAFWREAKDEIVMLLTSLYTPYANLANSRNRGIEGLTHWALPGRFLTLDGSVTWVDSRNVSKTGPFAPFYGMRTPSRPYLFASWGARARTKLIPEGQGALELFYYGRYVHGFDRSWAIGNPAFKISLPAQWSHDVGATYLLTLSDYQLTCTFEVDNLLNAELFDFFGVQRPGRSFNIKVTGSI